MSEEDSSQETGAMEASKSEKAVWSDPQRRGDKQPLVRIYKLDFFIMPIACKSTCSFFWGGGAGRKDGLQICSPFGAILPYITVTDVAVQLGFTSIKRSRLLKPVCESQEGGEEEGGDGGEEG